MLTYKDQPPDTVLFKLMPIGEIITIVDNRPSEQIDNLHISFESKGFELFGWKKGTYLFALLQGSKYCLCIEDPNGPLLFEGYHLITTYTWADANSEVTDHYWKRNSVLEMYPIGSENKEITWIYRTNPFDKKQWEDLQLDFIEYEQ